MNEVQMRNGATLAGASLIVLGVILLLITQGAIDLNMGMLWPVILVLVGAAMLGRVFTMEHSTARSAQIVVGTIPLLLGLFFLMFTLDFFAWSDLSTLWPVFPLIGGVAFLVAYLAGTREQVNLILGTVLTVIAVTFFTILQVGGSYSAFGKLWPIFLVMAGVILLVVPMLRPRRA